MKKLIFTISAILCLISCVSKNSEIRVGSYNLWITELGKGDYAWELRKERLAKSIAEIDFDIFGAQEVDTVHQKELPKLIREAGGADYRWFVFSPYDSLGGVGDKAQAVLYKADRFELLDSEHFWISETPDVMSMGWDEKWNTRGAILLKMKDLKTGKEFIFAHSHMPLKPKANFHGAEIITERAKRFNPENLPLFFVGDLNTTPDTNTSELFRKHWNDSYLSIPEKAVEGPYGTFNGARERDMRASRRIDYIYFSEGVNVSRYVNFTRQYEGLYPSDHCPVYVEATIE